MAHRGARRPLGSYGLALSRGGAERLEADGIERRPVEAHLLDSPLSPFCVFGLVFVFVCLVVGGCGVVCCVGVVCVWVGSGVMVFDVGVVWMGGSVLGPVWVRVCLAVCAFVRVSLLCCFGGEF